MPAPKYDLIYETLRRRIATGAYPSQTLLPSENTLVQEFSCSRNTIRRAIAALGQQGYVQSIHGKGVRVLYNPTQKAQFSVGRIESFEESALRNQRVPSTDVVHFEPLVADEVVHKATGFAVGTELIYLERVRKLDGEPLILDLNFFNADIVQGLTPEIAAQSIYQYLEQELGVTIGSTRRVITVERCTPLDQKYIHTGDYNCMAVVTGSTYTADGRLLEYTQSHHRPDQFVFFSTAQRSKLEP